MSERFDPDSSEYSVNHGIALYRGKVLDELNAKYVDNDPSSWRVVSAEHAKLNELYIRQFEKILAVSSREGRESVRRSFYFAYELGEDIANGINHYDFGTYLIAMAQQTFDEQREQLTSDASDYIASNPEVEGLVACYSDYLSDQDDERIALCEIVAGTTFMMIDQSIQERFIDAECGSIDEELARLLDGFSDDNKNR